MTVREIIRGLREISIIKTFFFNFHYLQFREAIKFPIIVGKGVFVKEIRGKIVFQEESQFGMLKIGLSTYGFQCRRDRTIWEQRGGLIKIKSYAIIGKGEFVSIGPNGVLELGKNTRIRGNGKLICFFNIKIGDNTAVTWDTTIIDTDFHEVINLLTGETGEAKKTIIIGNNNWVGFGTTILKGTETPDYCIIGAKSLLLKKYLYDSYCMLAGHPVKLIQTGVCRKDFLPTTGYFDVSKISVSALKRLG